MKEGNQSVEKAETKDNNIISSECYSKIDSYAEAFKINGFIKLPNILSGNKYDLIYKEALNLLENYSRRKDFVMEETDFTLRKISTVSGNIISKNSKLITEFYENKELINFLERISETKLFLTPDLTDRHTIHRLHKKGDEHGGHLDTYPYVLVFLLEHPEENEGGELKFVPNSHEIADLKTKKALIETFKSGECYFMRAGENVHCVQALKKDVNRTVLVLTYADANSSDILISYSSNKLYD